MDNQFMHRVSRLFPCSFSYSCHFRNLSDVFETSILPTPNPKNLLHVHMQHHPLFSSKTRMMNKSHKSYDHHSSLKNKQITNDSSKPKTLTFTSDAEGICNPKESSTTAKLSNTMNLSSSSFSTRGWFSSEEEGDQCDDSGKIDNFFSLSSGSSQSFYRKITNTRRRSGDHDISDKGLCSFEVSANPMSTLSELTRKTATTCRENTKKVKSRDQKTTENYNKKSKSHRRTQMDHDNLATWPTYNVHYYSDFQSAHRKTTRTRRRTQMDHDHLATENVNYYSDFQSAHRKTTRTRRKTSKTRRRRSTDLSSKMGEFWFVVDDGRFEESTYAVEKSSREPYSDFRASMVEMIVEKNIFRDEDLERLLHCFLCLNSSCFHEIIVEVFSEVWETLFTN